MYNSMAVDQGPERCRMAMRRKPVVVFPPVQTWGAAGKIVRNRNPRGGGALFIIVRATSAERDQDAKQDAEPNYRGHTR